ncbi:hypothetical protein [Vibrio breoganii]|uniref:hypothetical protein n=1 Tax=Vibrio breoganii TaxID=553239 RepID=UPI000C83771D|nr:hypothetical protein [Vibrio breoganii]PMO34641.1 hypothetical protein BCT12_13080 [Vibrio breoganii]
MDKSNGRIIALSLISLAVLSGCGGSDSDISQKKLDKIAKETIDKTLAEIGNIDLSKLDKQGYLYTHDFTEQALQLGYSKLELDTLCSIENIPENAMVSCQAIKVGDEYHPMLIIGEIPQQSGSESSTTIDLADKYQSLTYIQTLQYHFSPEQYQSLSVHFNPPKQYSLGIHLKDQDTMTLNKMNAYEHVDKDATYHNVEQTLAITFDNRMDLKDMRNIATNATGFMLAKTPLSIKTANGDTEVYPTLSNENYDFSLLPYAMKRYQTVLDHWRQ